MIIYVTINNINGKIYVGQSKYNRDSYKGSGLLVTRAFQKYGFLNFSKAILEYCDTIEQLNIREKYWIEQLNSLHPIGYNIAHGHFGGDVLSNHPDKLSIYKKQGDARRGKKYPNISKALVGRPGVNLGKPNPNKGQKNPKISIALHGKKSKLAVKLSINGEIYDHGRHATKHLKIRRSTIIERCKSSLDIWTDWFYIN